MRHSSDRNKIFESTDIKVGDSVIFYGQISRNSTPTWGGAGHHRGN